MMKTKILHLDRKILLLILLLILIQIVFAPLENNDPIIILNAPDNSSYTNNDWMLINFTVSHTDGEILNCSIFADNLTTPITSIYNNGSVDGSLTNVITYNFTSLSEYTYYWFINCSDDDGGSTNGTYNFIIDTINPLIELGSDGTDTGNYSQDWIYTNVTASDSNIDTITINLYNSTDDLVDTNNSASSPFITNFTGLSDGIYYINATINDSAGNSNSTETITIILDNTAPVITVISPEAIIYTEATVNISFSATDGLTEIDSYWFYNETGNTTYTIPTTIDLESGAYTFIFYANDSLGNVASESVSFTVTIVAGGLTTGESDMLETIYKSIVGITIILGLLGVCAIFLIVALILDSDKHSVLKMFCLLASLWIMVILTATTQTIATDLGLSSNISTLLDGLYIFVLWSVIIITIYFVIYIIKTLIGGMNNQDNENQDLTFG